MWSLVFLFAMKMEFTRPVVRAVRARGPTFAHTEGGGAPAPRVSGVRPHSQKHLDHVPCLLLLPPRQLGGLL